MLKQLIYGLLFATLGAILVKECQPAGELIWLSYACIALLGTCMIADSTLRTIKMLQRRERKIRLDLRNK